MNRSLFSAAILLVLAVAPPSVAQEYIKLPLAKNHTPTFVLNDTIIVSRDMLGFSPPPAFSDRTIKKVTVFKKSSGLENLDISLWNLTEHGLILLEVEDEISVKTQSEIRTSQGMGPYTDIYIDGYLLKGEKILIAEKSIEEIERVIPSEANGLTREAINIWTLKRDARNLPEKCGCIILDKQNAKKKVPAGTDEIAL